MVSSSGAVSRSMQQSTKAVGGPHGQQRSIATKAVYITCAAMRCLDNTPSIKTTRSGGGSDGNIAVTEPGKITM